jgi:hypothetical protein
MGPIENNKSVVCVVGGGNSAHVLIPFLSASGHKVNLMTRRPEAWSKIVTCELQSPSKKRTMVDFGNVKHPATDILQTVKGTINKKSSDPADVIPEAVSPTYAKILAMLSIRSMTTLPHVINSYL